MITIVGMLKQGFKQCIVHSIVLYSVYLKVELLTCIFSFSLVRIPPGDGADQQPVRHHESYSDQQILGVGLRVPVHAQC